ncbi:gp33 [Mycobacterium phage Che9c]|uniref:Uncharacterized protein n=1 Tax=Mycobacterium phage Che9c TaxID=2907832 RepID=Q854W4_9CAUD|nr:gp33 [Mycobacterium phage Che9c]AAN12594.1 hypothetical protein PBI_CHE9C_33 [Mycobacterium phage Che9c]
MTAPASPGGANVSPEEVDQLYENPKELEQSEDSPRSPAQIALSADMPGGNLLNGLVNAAPFSEFLHYKALANCNHKTDQGRVRKYSEEHPKLTKFCTIADLIFRVLVCILTLAAVGSVLAGVIIKTFYL